MEKISPITNKQSSRKWSLCIIHDECGFKNTEWIDIEGIEDYDSLVPDNNEINETSMPLINCDDENLEKWVGSPWKKFQPKDSLFLIEYLFKKKIYYSVIIMY